MRGHTLDHYAQVTEVYDEALDAGDPPTQAVAEAFAVPYTTAARWVRRARALELLPPAAPGVAAGNGDGNGAGHGAGNGNGAGAGSAEGAGGE